MQNLSQKLKDILYLSKISVTSSEFKDAHTDLTSILNILDVIKDVNTDNFDPLISPLELLDDLVSIRKDGIHSKNCSINLENFAPKYENNHFLVPKVINTKRS